MRLSNHGVFPGHSDQADLTEVPGRDLVRMAPGILQDLSPETLVRKHYSDALEGQNSIAKVAPVNDIK